jgi:hypothetical protein
LLAIPADGAATGGLAATTAGGGATGLLAATAVATRAAPLDGTGTFAAARAAGFGSIDRHSRLRSMRHPRTNPAAMPVATAARASTVFDA